MKLVVVGGGIAGLAAARAARMEAASSGTAVEITVLEASERLGGKLWTETIDGAALEWGPDSFLATKPWARELAEELGLELVSPRPQASRAFLLVDGRLRLLPPGLAMGIPTRASALVEAVRAGIVGPGGALRAWADRVLPAEPNGTMEPSVGEMARRRFGRSWTDRVIAPLIVGVYGVPLGEVSFGHAYPDALGARSLIAAARRRPRPSGPMFLSVRGGMGRLVAALVEDLADARLRTGCAAESISVDGEGLSVGAMGEDVRADAILLAVPAPAAARLLETVAPEAAGPLRDIRYSASAVVLLGYESGTIGRPLDGSGYLVAPQERAIVAACSWLPVKWAHAASAERVWLRAVVTDAKALALPDDVLKGRVRDEVDAAMEAIRPAADVRVRRWARSLPVFGLGHANRVAAIRRSLPEKITLAGAYLEGLGVSDCIRTGQEAARRLVRPAAG
ncbi:MAG: protoporphyrinogen oxidase [Actinomycetota bacterium]|nr:protoporphyrinogen oxidase [Actinomycetota bacterium]